MKKYVWKFSYLISPGDFCAKAVKAPCVTTSNMPSFRKLSFSTIIRWWWRLVGTNSKVRSPFCVDFRKHFPCTTIKWTKKLKLKDMSTVPTVEITILWDLTDGQTLRMKIVITTGRDCGSIICSAHYLTQNSPLFASRFSKACVYVFMIWRWFSNQVIWHSCQGERNSPKPAISWTSSFSSQIHKDLKCNFTFYHHTAINKKGSKTGVINDPLSQTHCPASSDHCFHLKIVLFWAILKSGDGRTDRRYVWKQWSLPAVNGGRPCGSKRLW